MADVIENIFTDEEIAQLEAEYGDICEPLTDDVHYSFVCKVAEPLQWRPFEAKAHRGGDEAAGATATLIEGTIVACVYKGEKAMARDDAKKLWKKLIKGRPAAASGEHTLRALMRLNGAAVAVRGK